MQRHGIYHCILLLGAASTACSAEPLTTLPTDNDPAVAYYDNLVHHTIVQAEQLAKEIELLVEHQLLEIVVYPLEQIDHAVADIEARRQESTQCVEAQAIYVASTLEQTTAQFLGCGRRAVVDSVQMLLDTKRAVLQLSFDGYRLAKQARHCRRLKSEFLTKICKTKLTVMALLYVGNGQRSVRTLLQLRRRAPGIAHDAQQCTMAATERTLQQLDIINDNIDVCVHSSQH